MVLDPRPVSFPRSSRTLMVSNRLSARVHIDGDKVSVTPSAGGLATTLRDLQAQMDVRWLGSPGAVPPRLRGEVARALDAVGCSPVFVDEDDARAYYDGYANGILWPLLHSRIDRLPFDADADFAAFARVNAAFAEGCVDAARAGDRVWVHDFQLMLVPGELRRRVHDARIGFFLHVPFPPAEVFAVLPRAETIVASLLAADLIGFHTEAFRQSFLAVARASGARVDGDDVEFAGRVARTGVFPIGVDFEKIDSLSRTEAVRERAAAIKSQAQGRRILLGVDRLDYTKGLPRRMLAVERLLERWPALAAEILYIQLAVPTRDGVDGYADFRGVVNQLVGRINGRFGSPAAVPIHFMHREVPLDELVALYAAADVMVVTPLQDGMNLVCKEYVAARGDEDGALVLSRFAGAAVELKSALPVNPFDIDDVAQRLHEAIVLPKSEQHARMSMLRRVVSTQTSARWAQTFLAALDEASAAGATHPLWQETAAAARAAHLHVILDYDGTLVPVVATPSAADPDPELLALLEELASCPETTVHIVSGRDRDTLDRWLGALPLVFSAEHGAHHRGPGDKAWTGAPVPAWHEAVAGVLQELAAAVPGAWLEEKHCTLALHTREVPDVERDTLEERVVAALAGRDDLSVLRGRCVVEARPTHVHKGRALDEVRLCADDGVVAIGDDITDDDLFAALPEGALAIGVGDRPAGCRYRVQSFREVRVLLRQIAAARRAPLDLDDVEAQNAA